MLIIVFPSGRMGYITHTLTHSSDCVDMGTLDGTHYSVHTLYGHCVITVIRKLKVNTHTCIYYMYDNGSVITVNSYYH